MVTADTPSLTRSFTDLVSAWPLGSWSRPVPAARVMEKARSLIAGAIGIEKSTAIERAIIAADNFSIRSLMAMLP
jgi:hypothetical protein